MKRPFELILALPILRNLPFFLPLAIAMVTLPRATRSRTWPRTL